MKAIIPIAGLGTRCLPFTKVIPKAMLPFGKKPCVQWIAEELSEAGVKEIIFVYSRGQEMVKEYFAEKTWYDEELEKRGKIQEAAGLEVIRKLARFHFVEQQEQLGDGHAVLQAKALIGDEPFLVIFGDCLYQGNTVIQKLQNAYTEKKTCIVAVQGIPREKAELYGIAEIGEEEQSNSIFPISSLMEKPTLAELTSSIASRQALALIGRYLLTPSIWPHLEKKLQLSGEVRLIDALKSLQEKETISGIELKGRWIDTGTLTNFL